jgi:hypothetical protein
MRPIAAFRQAWLRLVGDVETRRRRQARRAEEVWRARYGGWRDVRQPSTVCPGPLPALPHRCW